MLTIQDFNSLNIDSNLEETSSALDKSNNLRQNEYNRWLRLGYAE